MEELEHQEPKGEISHPESVSNAQPEPDQLSEEQLEQVAGGEKPPDPTNKTR